ncbi:MAG: TonB-dependent receptor domain-containing protein [Salinivirgaceae bacterium]|nr:TonB-dependent receptor [Bacteroidales bacterium]
MTHKKLFLITLFFLVTATEILAQTGSIKGSVLDSKTKESLIGAAVIIQGTTTGAAADLNGDYIIQNVAPGTYTLVVSYITYQSTIKKGVVVEKNKETIVDFLLEPDDISLKEVQVVAKANRESENILLLEQKKALLVTQTVGARELSRKGISDAQAAVAQVSGISKQEGVKNVFVRGLGDRYNATLLNGFPIPSEDPEYKNIALEFFGTDVIQNIGVNKVFNASNVGDVGGAVVDISSKELAEESKLSVDLSAGVNVAAVGADFVRQDGSNYLGFANTDQPSQGQHNFPNSLVPQKVSFPLNHGFGVSGGKLFSKEGNSNKLSIFVVASHGISNSCTKEIARKTNSIGAKFQDQEGDKYSQAVNQLALANAHYEIKNRHNVNYNFMLIHVNDQYVGEFSGFYHEPFQGSPTESGIIRRQQTNDNLLLVNQLVSDWQLTDIIKLNLGVAYNTVKGLEPDRRENYFTQVDENLYSLTRSNRNKRFFSDLKNNDLNAKVGLSIKLNDRFNSGNSSVQVGYAGRFTNDKFKAVEYNYSPLGTPNFTIEDLNLDEFYEEYLSSGLLKMEKGETNSYKVFKNIHSGFAEVSYQIAASLAGNIGLRMDAVDLTVDHEVTHVVPGSETINKNYFLPSLNLKYDINDKNSLRLGVSKTYTLPQSKEISPYQYVNISFASQGNTNIKPSDNYNVDLKWDFYITNSELFSITTFYKQIQNPIGRVDQGNSAGLLTYDNIGENATVGGIEIELRKNIFNKFNTLLEQSNRLSFGVNASYIYTNLMLDVPSTTPRKTQLEGASPFLMNADLSYSFKKSEKDFIASIIFNYFSDRVHTVGTKGFRDIIEEGVPTLDLVLSYGFNKNFSVNFKAINILDAPYRLSREGTTGEKIVLSEFKKGQNFGLGISYQF